MPFDEEELDPHGECAAEVTRLRTALDDIANGRLSVTDAMLESREAMMSALANYCQGRAREKRRTARKNLRTYQDARRRDSTDGHQSLPVVRPYMVHVNMNTKERRFVAAADDLYSAISQGSRMAWPPHLVKAMDEFAEASNIWSDHPGKLEEVARRPR